MSDLTRYEPVINDTAMGGMSSGMSPDPTHGEWVRASEAEAEITRLKAELESTKRGHSVQREALRKQLTQEREDRGGHTQATKGDETP